MVKKTTSKKGNLGAVVGLGVGIAAASVAAYLLFGPDGEKNRKKVVGWTVKMKGEIIEKFEKVKEVTEPIYQEIVDEVSKKYSKLKGIDKEELEAVVGDLKKNWKKIIKEAKPKKK
ncbi:MAG: hypothetical protein PHU17_02115 [Candidatus Pacebacteria bacterium]|nr:hypothetical protein [Candidatus Paceibacterota bacterium]